jgi:ATP-dependent Clp protease ATP-binding subunit ClpC
VAQLSENLKEKGIGIEIRSDGVDWLLGKTLQDRSYGARPLRRAIQRHIEDPLSEAFIRGQIRPDEAIVIGVEDGALWYWQGGQGGALAS